MKPIPVVFHIGTLQIHTYGIGLAITFWFGYRYFAKRLRDHGYPDHWLGRAFVWIIVASIVGARAVSVIANLSSYSHDPAGIFAVWHGGLSSFGGLAGGVPAGLICARRWCPQLRMSVAIDLVAPVLISAWAVGKLLGPQLMVAGGGPRTSEWYGMYYADQVGKRVPVPLWQAIECTAIFIVVLWVERWIARRGGPLGVVITSAVALYGLSRFFDEYLFLSHGAPGDVGVEVISLVFVGVGLLFAVLLVRRARPQAGAAGARSGELPPRGGPGDPWAAPPPPSPVPAVVHDGAVGASDGAVETASASPGETG